MEAFFSLITHLSLLILLFQAAHSGTVTGNGVADQWRHPSVHYVQESIKGFELREDDMAFSPESSPLAAPAPTPGGVISTSPDYTWPFHYKQVNSPSSSPTTALHQQMQMRVCPLLTVIPPSLSPPVKLTLLPYDPCPFLLTKTR
ncbi:hypothetical protein CK203_080338 [Vitis vinifera]|uniref:Uncharacterized protein n=1 Tax=Vitis vinifera TaxID=29760 RepID=A0A438CNG0_VITVI|nr:hypothetical protein CK203_080338 [Vitis vinifera]